MTNDEFLSLFESLKFPIKDFHNEEHVRLAWVYLTRHSLIESLQRFVGSLKAFVAFHRAEAKYHETITWSFLLLINERMLRANSIQTWKQFRTSNPDLFASEENVLTRYYSDETLRSEFARSHFVMPNLGVVGV